MRTCMGYTVSVWTRGPPLSPPGPAPHRPLHRPQFGFRAFRADRPRGRAKPKKNTDRAINWRLIARRRPEVLVNTTASSQIYGIPHFDIFTGKVFISTPEDTVSRVCPGSPRCLFTGSHATDHCSMKFTPVFFRDAGASLALLTRGPRRRRLDGDRLSIPQPGGRH